jgi:hypothetical protein
VLLDVLRRCGWRLEDIDVATFARAAAYCGEMIPAHDLHGNAIETPRFQCNLVLQRRRSAADVIRGIRNGARLLLTYSLGGRLELRLENTLPLEQPDKPAGSNSTLDLDGGWPCYEFGDGSNGFSGILRRENGEPAIRMWSRTTAETANRVSLEFQDGFNEYQQDSVSLTDLDDVLRTGQEISLSLPALGVANFDQAARVVKFYLDKAITGNRYVELETSVRGLGLKPGDLITVTYLKEGLDRQLFRILKIVPGLNYRTSLITAQIHRDWWYADDNTGGLGNSGAGRQAGAEIGMPRPLTGNIVDENGERQFEITEKSSQGTDGGTSVTLAAGFTEPARPSPSGASIPLLSLGARIDTSGGTLAGDRTYYYAVSAVDESGGESALSFVVRAVVPPGTDTNAVTLTGLSFSQNTTGFHVYRGANPSQLFRIAEAAAVAAEFTDTGLASEPAPPPDENYDHANFHWRMEAHPESAATICSNTTIGNVELALDANAYRGMAVRITRGTGAGQERTVLANSATTLTVSPKWTVSPDASSYFAVAESGWHFGAAGASSPVEFEVLNRLGATVQVCGRAANVHDRECAYELSPVTRWRISGSGAADIDVPPAPAFGLTPRGHGMVELTAIAFANFTNTRTITSATLTLDYWNELSSPSAVLLEADVTAADTILDVSAAGGAEVGGLAQIGAEIVRIEQVLNGGLQYEVSRGAQGSTAAGHAAGAPVYALSRKSFVAPFPRDFFGSPASGSFSYPILIPDARVACGELFVTNWRGHSPTAVSCYTGMTNGGIRTLSGGQFSIQLEGSLAIQTNAAPAVVVQASHSVRDILAVVRDAPVGGPIELDIRLEETVYCHLTIPENRTYSDPVNGFGLPPLASGSRINLDITSTPQAAGSAPGRDLTVTIRL